LNFVFSALDYHFSLLIQCEQRFGYRLFTVTASHALNGENLVHDVPFLQTNLSQFKA
jgi:hypothetical protein